MPCLLAHARPALPPPSPSPLLIVSCSRDTRILFLVISFPFVSPFCGSTKRIGPFVLPQKGRTVPSLFLFFISPQIFGRSCCGHLLERFLWTGLLRDFQFDYGGGIWVYYGFRPKHPRLVLPTTAFCLLPPLTLPRVQSTLVLLFPCPSGFLTAGVCGLEF